jgi:hypothetical protein
MVRMIEDDNQQFLARFSGGRRAKRTEARALRAEFSERSKLRKTATKPAEFSSPNRSTQTYYIINPDSRRPLPYCMHSRTLMHATFL